MRHAAMRPTKKNGPRPNSKCNTSVGPNKKSIGKRPLRYTLYTIHPTERNGTERNYIVQYCIEMEASLSLSLSLSQSQTQTQSPPVKASVDKILVDSSGDEDASLISHYEDSDEESLLPPPETTHREGDFEEEDDEEEEDEVVLEEYVEPTDIIEEVEIEVSPTEPMVLPSALTLDSVDSFDRDEQFVDDNTSTRMRKETTTDTSYRPPGPAPVQWSDCESEVEVEVEVETDDEQYVVLPPESSQEAAAATTTTSPGGTVHYNNKVERRIHEALATQDFSNERGRSADLIPLSRAYQGYRKDLRKLIKRAKEYGSAQKKLASMRARMMEQCVKMSEQTPMYEHVGQRLESSSSPSPPASRTRRGTNHQREEDRNRSIEQLLEYENPLSLASIEEIHAFYNQTSVEEFETYVIHFASEWEDAICTRLDREIGEVTTLQRRKIHYERKVDGLRKKVNRQEKRGKGVPIPVSEKLTRNEEKLADAWKIHEQRSAQLCFLLEECVYNGYKDLYVFTKNLARFEINNASRMDVVKMKMKANLMSIKATDFNAVPEQTGPEEGLAMF